MRTDGAGQAEARAVGESPPAAGEPAPVRPRLSRDESIVVAVTASLAVLFGSLAFGPPPPADEEYRQIGALCRKAMDEWHRIDADHAAGRISAPEAADRLESDVLPVWRIATARLNDFWQRYPPAPPDPILIGFLDSRAAAWLALAEAARFGNPANAQLYQSKWAESEFHLNRLRDTPTAPARPMYEVLTGP